MKTAWLIGAGFSYEFGMPLVWELTKELLDWLTPAKLRELNREWKSKGNGYPDTLIEEYASVIDGTKLHYEELIGWLQKEAMRPCRHEDRQHLLHLSELLADCVALILRGKHSSQLELLKHSLPWFAGLADHVDDQGQLWMFSLNHDICVEMLGAELGIDVCCGYEEAAVPLLTTSGQTRMLDRLTRDRIAAGKLDFGASARRGINLVKLHGSLDVFGYDNLKSYLRARPVAPGAQGWLAALESIENDLHAVDMGVPIKLGNEICVRDEGGEIQFLRRTNVIGALKFSPQMTHNAPAELIPYFAGKLDEFERLAVIGYSWGDAHVNAAIEEWLARRPDAKIVVVNPGGLPDGVAHLAARCEIQRVPAAEYVSARRWASFSNVEMLRRRLGLIGRRDPSFPERGKACMEEARKEHVRKIVALLEAAPQGASEAELIAQAPTLEDVLSDLLSRLEPTSP